MTTLELQTVTDRGDTVAFGRIDAHTRFGARFMAWTWLRQAHANHPEAYHRVVDEKGVVVLERGIPA